MDPALISLLGVVFASALGLAGIIYSVRSSRRAEHRAAEEKKDREALAARLAAEDSAYARSAAFDERTQLRMQAQIDRQAEQIDTQAAQIGALQKRVHRLTRQMIAAGLTPEEDPVA